MPNKTIPSWTQVPIVGSDLLQIRYDRLVSGGTSNQLTAVYDVRDDQGAVRACRTHSQQVGTYPVSIAAILSAINSAEGT